MKKFLPIILIGSLIFSIFIPIGNAFASDNNYSNGLLEGISSQSGNFNATDNDVSTGINLGKGNALFDLGGSYTISKVIWNVSCSACLNLELLDGSNNVLVTLHPDNDVLTDITPVDGVSYVRVVNTNTTTRMVNELEVFNSIVHDEITNLISASSDYDSVTLSWDIPTGNGDFTGSKIYRNGIFLTSVNATTDVYTDSSVLSDTTYTYKITAVYSDGFETNGIVSSVITPIDVVDLTPPSEVENVAYNIASDSIALTFDNPLDDDFLKANVYVNGVLHGSTMDGTYMIANLNPETNYSIKITALDLNNNESIGVTQTIKTGSLVDLIAPNPPTGVTFESASNGGILSWKRNTETDIRGYNIYIDGIKDNAVPVTSISYSVIGLDPDTTYSIKVTAVDTSGNESGFSSSVSATPNVNSIPLLKMGYSLSDVASGVGSWFSSIWLIVAFAVAIPLSFYISSRIKLLFLS